MPTQAPPIHLPAGDGWARARGPGLGPGTDEYGACVLHFRPWAHLGYEICIYSGRLCT